VLHKCITIQVITLSSLSTGGCILLEKTVTT